MSLHANSKLFRIKVSKKEGQKSPSPCKEPIFLKPRWGRDKMGEMRFKSDAWRIIIKYGNFIAPQRVLGIWEIRGDRK